jgi:hypothetical protein
VAAVDVAGVVHPLQQRLHRGAVAGSVVRRSVGIQQGNARGTRSIVVTRCCGDIPWSAAVRAIFSPCSSTR